MDEQKRETETEVENEMSVSLNVGSDVTAGITNVHYGVNDFGDTQCHREQ